MSTNRLTVVLAGSGVLSGMSGEPNKTWTVKKEKEGIGMGTQIFLNF